LAHDVAVPGTCLSCRKPLTKGTIWIEPTATSSWFGFHLSILLATHAIVWALSILAYLAASPDALNGVIFVFAILLAAPTFALALCMVLFRVMGRSNSEQYQNWRRTIVIGNSIVVGLHILVVVWSLGYALIS
jgi:hypothetical protein